MTLSLRASVSGIETLSAYRSNRPVDISSFFLSDGFHVGHRVIDYLFGHGPVHLASAYGNGVSSPDIGAGAMAAMSAAMVMIAPAEAARAPLGPT